MGKPDWLSIEEITHLWSEETGLAASDFQYDLEQWFAGFVKQQPASRPLLSGESAGTTNRLMGMLGARYLERSTFEAYCQARGHPVPQFWCNRSLDTTWREEPNQFEPTPARCDAAWSKPSEKPADGWDQTDPALVAFQTQIASLSERLTTPDTEVPSISKSAPATQRNCKTERGQNVPTAKPNQQDLSKWAAAADADARDLKARLGTAEQRIADLSTQLQASRATSVARLSERGPASPPQERLAPSPSAGPVSQNAKAYRDPSATSQLLRLSATRRTRRRRVALTAGVAVVLGALLFIWPNQAPVLATLGERFQPDAALRLLEPVIGVFGFKSDESRPSGMARAARNAATPALEQDLTAPQQRIVGLNAAVASTEASVVGLRDELLAARRETETARQTTTLDASTEMREQRLWSQALSAEVEIAGVRAALQLAEAQAAQAESARQAAVDEAAGARTALANTEQKVATLKRQLDAARSAVDVADERAAGTRVESSRLRAENARLNNELEKAQAHVSSLRASLKKAELIANLRKVVGAAED